MQAMNWSDKTSFLLVDNILLINAHLSSNKEKNPPQMESVKSTLKVLKQTQPNLHIILGGDLNAYLISNPEFDKMFHMFPVSKDDITTIKMRTKAQGQYEKGNVPNIESKDKIITDLNIKKDSGLITFIDGKTKPDLKSYIPTDGHPFDHFLVACRVIKQ
uniref:Predicted protein n=1 Tax=Hordeum vulgare subsp. vulgare TaxID=112509 RepID=F2DRZ9_HORVV|nr:predicted protein [Hordeum vulgare subsp. vulgare]